MKYAACVGAALDIGAGLSCGALVGLSHGALAGLSHGDSAVLALGALPSPVAPRAGQRFPLAKRFSQDHILTLAKLFALW